MATWDDVRTIALSLPETSESTSRGTATWLVKDKMFVWDRPLTKTDIKALGEAAPTGAILGARVPDEGAKHALVAEKGDVYFTTPHFDGYPAILVQLDNIGKKALKELIVEAWLSRAPKRLAEDFQPPDA